MIRAEKTVDNSNSFVTLRHGNICPRIFRRAGIFALCALVRGIGRYSRPKVATALYRLEQGNFSRVEGVEGGVYECKINFGPGYRVYFGKEGEEVIILLGGGSKKRQRIDISNALSCWQDYKRRKR